jgi:hypothetical protein
MAGEYHKRNREHERLVWPERRKDIVMAMVGEMVLVVPGILESSEVRMVFDAIAAINTSPLEPTRFNTLN